MVSSLAHGCFNILTAEMVNDLTNTHHQKPKLPPQTSKSLTYLTDNPLDSIKNPTSITSSPPF